ncbi:HET-domain-containing protein [Curvularia clavata]|uniref:HET-domain-containing protein n=1 Tax=Curvularia clavata TaxID=95742 RepID=A0A9Q8Z6H6_CURCL|nr:HET-domain-containing protein [Curvularia clavata]
MEPLPAFTYEPLTANADLRLFLISPGTKKDRITGVLKEASFTDDANAFCALSYCWGAPNFTEEILINGCSFKVTPNLHNALRNLRDVKQEVRLWIDQICINQNDDEEKGRQVKLMSRIYECAGSVAIWLGALEHPKRTERILKRLKPVYEMLPKECFDGQCDIKSVRRLTPKQMSILNLPSPKSTGWAALQSLLSVAWFSRSWIVQEASMANIAQFSWGHGWTDWDTIVAVLQALHLVLPPNVLGCSPEDIPANIVLDIDRVRRSLRERKAPDIVSLALRYKHLAAFDPRDKLYAFLSLSRQQEPFPVSYGIPKEELYCLVAHQAIDDALKANSQRANLEANEGEYEWHPDSVAVQGPSSRLMALLCSAGLANHSPECRLPSWAPDWAFQSKANPIWTTQVERRTSGTTWWPPTIYESRIIRTRLALKAAYQRWQSRGHTVQTIESTTSTTMTMRGTRVTNESTTTTRAIGGGPGHTGKTNKYIIYDPRLTTVSWEGSYHTEGTVISTASLPDTLILEGICIEEITTCTLTNMEPDVPLDKNPDLLQQWLSLAHEMSLYGYSSSRRSPLYPTRPLIHILCMDMVTEAPDAAIITEVPPMFQISAYSDYDDQMRRYLETHHYLLALRNIRYREFFRTSEGLMGLGPRGTRQHDEIWAIAGFKVPLVFRKEGNVHRLIGECFIDSADTMAELTQERNSYGKICVR